MDVIRPAVSQLLYKYSSATRLDWLRTILLSHQLYFPTPTELNDPRDARPPVRVTSRRGAIQAIVTPYLIQYARDPLASLAADVRRIHDTINGADLKELGAVVTRLFHEQMNRNRIYSMTTRPDNEHLWRQYAGNHTGYCLEFSRDGAPFETAHHVIYRDEIPPDFCDDGSFGAELVFQKTPRYAAEEEVRIILLPRGSPAVVPFEPTLLLRIILGDRMSGENAELVRGWCAERIPELSVSREGH